MRVTTTFALAHRLVAPRLGILRRRYPELRVRLDLRNERVDLVREGFDLGFRVGALDDEGYVSRTIARSGTGLIAAKTYVAANGLPERPEYLDAHAMGVLAPRAARDVVPLRLRHDGGGDDDAPLTLPLRPRLMVNDPKPLLDAVSAGACIALLPDLIALPEIARGACVHVLPDWRGPPQDYCAVYPSRRGLPHRVRVLLDHLVQMGNATSAEEVGMRDGF